MRHYHKLQEKLDAHPIGAPRSEEFLEILKILFHSDEVELATLLEFKLQKTSDVAKKAGKEKLVATMLATMMVREETGLAD